MTNQTGMIGNFLVDGATIGGMLQKLTNKVELGDLETSPRATVDEGYLKHTAQPLGSLR